MLNLLPLFFILNSWGAPPIQNITCFNEVTNTFIKLNVNQKWERVYQKQDFTYLKSPSGDKQNFEVWLSSTSEEAILTVKKQSMLIQNSFKLKQKCKMQSLISDEKEEHTFSSLDFFKESMTNSKFVIILWSPHMAISLQQLQDLKNKNFAVPVIFLLEQNADKALAKKFIVQENLPENYLRKWNFNGSLPSSIEHYPSTLFINNGKVVKYIPGYNRPLELSNLIRNNL